MSEQADRKVIETAAALREVLLEEQDARAAEHRREQEQRAKERRRDRVERLVTLVTVLLLLIVAVSNRGVLREVENTGQEVKDCTTPAVSSDCARRTAESGAKALAQVRADIITASVAGAICAQLHSTAEDEVRGCVEAHFPPEP